MSTQQPLFGEPPGCPHDPDDGVEGIITPIPALGPLLDGPPSACGACFGDRQMRHVRETEHAVVRVPGSTVVHEVRR